MTLRIAKTGLGPPATTVKVDGRLTGDEVPELRGACEEIEGRLVLDLTDLKSADRQGVSVLWELRAKGADFIGVSPYLELLLDRQSHGAGN
jgi:anti-anti-sigma regulatory factor